MIKMCCLPLDGLILKGYHSCVNGVACCLCGRVICLSGLLFLVSAVALGRVDCSVCHSFAATFVGVCVCVCHHVASFSVFAGIQLGILYPGVFFGFV